MENQITVQEPQMPVKFQGAQLLVPESILASLPEIVKIEVLYPKINDKEAGYELRAAVTMRLISMLSINFINDQDRLLAEREFKTFLREYSLTQEEILEAYRKAIKLELTNHKGEVIKVYPNLSIIQAGEILNAYREFKIENTEHTRGHNILKNLNKTTEKMDPEKIHQELLQTVFQEIAETGFSSDAWLLFKDLEDSGKIKADKEQKKKLYQSQLSVHVAETKNDAAKKGNAHHARQILDSLHSKIKAGESIGSVQNRCRAIMASAYLKNHVADFETFKNAIDG